MTWLYDAAAKLQTFPPNIGECLREAIDFVTLLGPFVDRSRFWLIVLWGMSKGGMQWMQ